VLLICVVLVSGEDPRGIGVCGFDPVECGGDGDVELCELEVDGYAEVAFDGWCGGFAESNFEEEVGTWCCGGWG